MGIIPLKKCGGSTNIPLKKCGDAVIIPLKKCNFASETNQETLCLNEKLNDI